MQTAWQRARVAAGIAAGLGAPWVCADNARAGGAGSINGLGFDELATEVTTSDIIAVLLIFGILSFALFLWINAINQRLRRRQHRRAQFAAAAMNNLPHGFMMVDGRGRVVFCNDRYLQLYGLTRSDLRRFMPFAELLALRKARGTYDGEPVPPVQGRTRDDYIREVGGRSIKVLRHWLGGGGFVSIHEDCTVQLQLSRQLATTKSFLESVIDNIPVCVAVKSLEDGRYILANRAFEQFSRFPREKLVGSRPEEIFTPQTAAAIVKADNDAITSPGGVLTMEFVVERGSEQRILGARRVVARDEAGKPQFLIALFDDVTDRRALINEVEETKKFLELVVDYIPTAVLVKHVKDRRYLVVNRQAEDFMKRSRQQMLGKTIDEFHGPQRARYVNGRDNTAIAGNGAVVTEDFPDKRDEGMRLFQTRRVAVPGEDGQPEYLILTAEDVTERRQTEARLAHMVYHDSLTNLPNRVAFTEALTHMIENCADGASFAVLSVDLDRFKEVNDVFGHKVGDELLIAAAERIQTAAEGAVVARLGGDEFGLIVGDVQPQAGHALAQRVAEAIEPEFVLSGKVVRTRGTIGLAIFPQNGQDAGSLMANAAAALFRAKAEARGSLRLFEAEMDAKLRDRRVMHQELAQAIRNGEIVLHFQPQTAVDRTVTGFEALARWQHPVRGGVPPDVFIPLAEESGMIVQMGEWILREACIEAASWPKPLPIAVNLSPVQFLHGDLVASVHMILMETKLAPSRLMLEITESVLIEDFDRGLSLLRRLKTLGVGIALDDFGSGYSSLSYLQSFPFDKIKIDRRFTMNIGRNPQSAAIVSAVIGLCHGLGVPVVAEGVETPAQLKFLAGQGCDEIQGFFVGRPAPIGEYRALIGKPDAPMRGSRRAG